MQGTESLLPMRNSQTPATLSNPRPRTRNEQASGSSLLGGSHSFQISLGNQESRVVLRPTRSLHPENEDLVVVLVQLLVAVLAYGALHALAGDDEHGALADPTP
jgi:hypothetical protein